MVPTLPGAKSGAPRSPEAEKACLGALLLDPDGISKLDGVLEDKDFFEEVNRRIFRALTRLYGAGRPIDIITINNELQGDSLYQGAGGEAYLTDLMEKVGSAAHIHDYARIVREKAVKRELLRAGIKICEDVYREDSKADSLRPTSGVSELLDRAESLIFRLSQERSTSGMVKMSEFVHPLMENLEKARGTDRVIGLSSGFAKLDEYTAGLQKGEFIIVGARPGQGKTALAMNIACHAGLTQKKAVAIFSLEMSKEAILLRMLCAEARIDSHRLRKGYLDRERFGYLTEAASRVLESDIYIDDTAGLSCLEVRSRARRLAHELNTQKKELSLVIVDYLQLLRHGDSRFENRQQEVSEISRSLKALSKDLNVPLVALSQFSRRPEERDRSGRPQLSDLRESGSLEQDADVVLMIYRPGLKKDNPTDEERRAVELIIGKQRNGPLGTIPLVFLDYCTRFVEPVSDGAVSVMEEAQTLDEAIG